jgi:threonine-phosphate decarboxylase
MVMHGGRALMFAREHNVNYRDVLDFSASINPLGPSPKALAAIKDGADLICVYPEENPVRLIRCLSDRVRIPSEKLLVGNGATELLYFWLRAIRPRTATLFVPTFVEYRKALESVGSAVETVQLNAADHFRLPSVPVNTDVVIVTNPNNPTGSYTPPEEMVDWINRIPASTHVFIDEAFVEFTAQPSIVRYTERFPNLWILRSMTKFYALPGLRLGYLAGSRVPELLSKREPWQVNTLAELAGLASLEDRAHEEETMQLIQRERVWLWKQLQNVAAIRAFPSDANFFLARCHRDEALDSFIRTLADAKILIRDCRHIEGLEGPDAAYFRFAIRTRPENSRLLEYMRKL